MKTMKGLDTEFITEEGCNIIARMGRDIPNFNPINFSAFIHYLDNRNCPNGLMPLFALVIMDMCEMSNSELSFNAAHKIIKEFARKYHTKGSANLEWLRSTQTEWSSKKNDTTEKVFTGTYQKVSGLSRHFSLPFLTSASPLHVDGRSRNERSLRVLEDGLEDGEFRASDRSGFR